MSKTAGLCFLSALALAASVATATAGLNSGAVARIYWQAGSTGAALSGPDNSSGTCQLVVTAKGLTNFRGADVQLVVSALDGGAMPAAWQGQTGGCAEGFINCYVGGRGGSLFPNAFTTAPAVQGTFAPQNEELYNYPGNPCITPHGIALLFLSAAGAYGETRSPSIEYALWAVSFDLANSVDPVDGVTPCGGGVSDPSGPRGVCINPNERIPCNETQRGAVVQVLDGNLDLDYPAFVAGRVYLTWSGGSLAGACPSVTSSKTSTWGSLKKLYK